MNIGITGANGFIGRNFLYHCLQHNKNSSICCLVRHTPSNSVQKEIHWIEGDLLNEEDCNDFVRELDVIVHFAQSNSPAISDRHWASDHVGSISPSLKVLDALRRRQSKKICHFIFASSGGSVYGANKEKIMFSEADYCVPMSPYGIEKLAIEHYLNIATAQGWLKATVLRISNAYGEIFPIHRRQGLIGVAMARILAGLPVEIFGNDQTVRDYIYIDDVVEAFQKAITCITNSSAFNVYNIGSASGYNVCEVLEIIGSTLKKKVMTINSQFGEAAISLVPNVILSNKKAKNEIGWEPKVDLHKGIELMAKKYSSII